MRGEDIRGIPLSRWEHELDDINSNLIKVISFSRSSTFSAGLVRRPTLFSSFCVLAAYWMPCIEKTLWPTLLAVQTTKNFCTAQRSVMVGPTQQKDGGHRRPCFFRCALDLSDLSVEGRGNLIC